MHSGARQLPIQHLSVRLPWHDTGWRRSKRTKGSCST